MMNEMFRGLSEDEVEEFLKRRSIVRRYYKGEAIRTAGDISEYAGIVLEGCVYIESCDEKGNGVIFSCVEKGNGVIFSCVEKGGIFGASYAITGMPSMVDVISGTGTEILFVDMHRLLDDEVTDTENIIRGNMLRLLAGKNMSLSRKIRNTSGKTIREKLISFLRDESLVRGKSEFDISFDRQTLAEYLNCDRSQLSKEISGMKKDGLLESRGKHFKIFF